MIEKKKKYNAAVIGCGRIGALLENDRLRVHPCTHCGAYFQHNKINLKYVCDLINKKLNFVHKKFCIPKNKLYKNYKNLLKKQDIDILSISVDTEFHYEILSESLKNKNIKTILLEKPVVATLNEYNQLIKIIKKYPKKKILINHERRFNSEFKYVKNLISRKKLGKLFTITGNVLTRGVAEDWHSNWKKSGGGTLLHDGTHLIDIMTFFAGQVKSVTGKVKFPKKSNKFAVENSVTSTLNFKNGITGFIEASSNRNYFNFELDLQFQKGRIKIGNGIFEIWKTIPSKRYENFYDLTLIPKPKIKSKNFFIEVVDEIIKTIEKKRFHSNSTLKHGMVDFNIIMAIYYSGIKQGKKIHLPFIIDKHPFYYKKA